MESWACAAMLAFAASAVPSWGDTARDSRVQQDLAYVADQIATQHPNPFTKISREEFNARRQAILDAIPSLNDVSAYLRIKGLAASIGDAHTSLAVDGRFYQVAGVKEFPLRATLYDDGLFVSATDGPHSQYLGWSVVNINGHTPDEIIEASRSFISYDNEQWLRQQFIELTRAPGLMYGAGLGDEATRGTWLLEDLAGRRVSLVVEGTESGGSSVQVNDPAEGYLSPTYLDAAFNYWYRYYPEQKLLFFKYNVCAERRDLPFSLFAANLMNELETKAVDSLVVDLRDNTGGNSEVWRPFLNGLQTRYTRLRQNPRFGFYGLISRLTFSSGMFAAQEIKRFAGARLVGEDTGGNPDAFGDTLNYTLPVSGLRLSISTRHFSPFGPGVRAPAVAADIRVFRDSADVFARFDPILFAVFALKDGGPRMGDRKNPVVSAAGLRPGSVQAAGSLSTVFGDFGSVAPSVASSVPLPDMLGDVRVLVGGRRAPLLYASPAQINFQQPSGVLAPVELVEVERAGHSIWKGTETTSSTAPAIFISDPTSFRRPGAVLNEDGISNSATHPTQAGQVIQIFSTGYPELTATVAAGHVPQPGTWVRTVAVPTVWIGQWPAEVLFSGASPEFPGVWQIDARVPAGIEVGMLMPVTISVAGQLSNAVTIWME